MPKKTPMPPIRPACPEDLPALLTLVNGLAAFHDDPPNADLSALNRDLFTDPVVICLVADGDAGLVGYVALTTVVQWQFGVRGLDMHHLFTAPDHRGAGVGAALVGAALHTARQKGCAYVTVGTHPDNLAAQGFYLSQGFQRRPDTPARFSIRLRAV